MNRKDMHKETKKIKRLRRHKRVISRIQGSRGSGKPRLVAFRSLRHISVQLIHEGKTIASASDKEAKGKKKPLEVSREVGRIIAQKALKQNIKSAVFDRAGYKYHGNIKAIAEGAREAGLQL